MKIKFKLSLILIIISLLFSSVPVMATTVVAKSVNPIVKKSINGLCHKKGTRYYNATKKFKAYNTIKDRLKSGGKLPK